jgi:formylglycine-generating enzyme
MEAFIVICSTAHGVFRLMLACRAFARMPATAIGILALLLASIIILPAPRSARAAAIPTVLVGNPGNGNDPLTGNLYGGVAHSYRIGTTEVTNAQYVDFLNAKASSDPLNLYNTSMGSDALGGITRGGVSGNYTYAAKPDMGDKPVNYVSWYDSIRFANWLNNGQGTGDTETGAYTLDGGTPTPSNGLSIIRNAGATWFLPSENEWYKAAYYQPSAQGGDADNYWLYPTASNSGPTMAAAIDLAGLTRGDVDNPGINVANFNHGADWNGLDGNVTTVGSAGPLSQSFFGTSDQGGNLWEWNESLVSGSSRGLRGGSFGADSGYMLSSSRNSDDPAEGLYGGLGIGFRVATVPEPSTAVLGIFAVGTMWVLRKRPK